MDNFVQINLNFEDFSCYQLAEITELKLAGLKINYPVINIPYVFSEIFYRIPDEQRRKRNASLCQDLLNEIFYAQEDRLDPDKVTKKELLSISVSDIELGGDQLVKKLTPPPTHQKRKTERKRMMSSCKYQALVSSLDLRDPKMFSIIIVIIELL